MEGQRYTVSPRETFNEFLNQYSWISWIVALFPSLIISLLFGIFSVPSYISDIVGYFFAVYFTRLFMRVYITHQSPRLWKDFKNLNYPRDFVGVLLMNLPQAIFVYSFAFLAGNKLAVSGVIQAANDVAFMQSPGNIEALANQIASFLEAFLPYATAYLVLSIVLQLFVFIPLSGTVYLLSKDSQESMKFSFKDIWEKLKFSFKTFNRWEYKWQLIKMNLFFILLFIILGFIMIIPILGFIISGIAFIYVIPFMHYYTTKIYMQVFEREGVDMSSWARK